MTSAKVVQPFYIFGASPMTLTVCVIVTITRTRKKCFYTRHISSFSDIESFSRSSVILEKNNNKMKCVKKERRIFTIKTTKNSNRTGILISNALGNGAVKQPMIISLVVNLFIGGNSLSLSLKTTTKQTTPPPHPPSPQKKKKRTYQQQQKTAYQTKSNMFLRPANQVGTTSKTNNNKTRATTRTLNLFSSSSGHVTIVYFKIIHKHPNKP